MSLTEVVFEVQRPEDPLSAYTSRVDASKVVLRPLAHGNASALLTATGPMERTSELVRTLRDTGWLGPIEVASLTPYALVVRVLDGDRRGKHDVVEAVIDAFGRDSIVEPIVFEAGRMRVRVIIPRRLDTRDVVTRLKTLMDAKEWRRFRVVRVADFSPIELSLRLRRILTTEQEELLRLAHSMGYYESPRRCTLEDIAGNLAVSVSPVHKKLKEMEHILIDLYLDPRAIPPKRRHRGTEHRAPILGRSPEAGPLREVTFTVSRDEYSTVRFTRNHPDAQVIMHGIYEEDGLATYLMIVLAGPKACEELTRELGASPRVKDVQIIASDPDHLSLKVTTIFARRNKEWAMMHGDRNPLDALENRFGRDTFLKPIVVENGTMLCRAVIARKLPDDEVIRGFEELLKETHWDEFDVLGLRDVSMEPTLVGSGGRGEVTMRQEEVLRVAHALGYYKTPRECTLNDIATTLGISTNAVHKNLTSAEQKILQNYLGVF